MRNRLKNLNFYFIIFADIVLFTLAHIGAYLIRFDFVLSDYYIDKILKALLPIILIKILFFILFNLYRGMWRYTSITDMRNLLNASFFSTVTIIAFFFITYQYRSFSRAVFIIDAFLTFLFTGGFRLAIRIYYQEKSNHQRDTFFDMKKDFRSTLIVGAGNTGEKTLREILNNTNLPYRIMGFLDDDPSKFGQSIHGVRILGNVDDLGEFAKRLNISEVLIATPTATGGQMRRIVDYCNNANIKFKSVPGWAEIIEGKTIIKTYRDVNYADLLRREPVELDMEGIKDYIEDKIIMVTGAGGSIGSELCRQIVRFNPRNIVLVDASECNLYNIQMELKHRIQFTDYVTVLSGIQNEQVMEKVFSHYRPDVVFHAAAYKHVPMLERNPWQAVCNNIYGTSVLIEMSIRYGVKRFVFVSTDKAVNPSNVMGASKRVCELLVQAHTGNGYKTRMMSVRFGNVVGSAGSVIPLFQKQIQQGGPVTVTHPEITRFFMTISEAVQLIIQAGAIGQGGEIFVLEMGMPIKIADMARDLIRLSGKEPDRDIQVVFTGLRSGEKLYEELITDGENVISTSHEKIMVLKSDSINGCSCMKEMHDWVHKSVDTLHIYAEEQDSQKIRECLNKLIPEYCYGECQSIL